MLTVTLAPPATATRGSGRRPGPWHHGEVYLFSGREGAPDVSAEGLQRVGLLQEVDSPLDDSVTGDDVRAVP